MYLLQKERKKVNNMKKFTATLITLVLLISTLFQTASFAAFTDVAQDNPHKKAINTLSLLKVIDGYTDGTFKPDGEITRAEFTKLIVFILGYQDLKYGEYSFSDVTSEHWAKNYIQTAYNLGIIAGMGDGTFAPDTPVTYEQALKMIVCTLGYQDFAASLGSYPEGYIQQANKLSLTDNISTPYSAGAPRSVIAQALYNALETDIYEYNGSSWEKTEKTLINDYLKVKEVKGTLIGVEDYVTEDCKHELLEGEMSVMNNSGEEFIINYSSFTDNISDINKYLGSTITVYYSQPTENDEKMLVIIDSESTKNSQFEINYNDLNSFEGNTLKYFDSTSKSKNIKLKDKDLTIRYNGKLVGANEVVTLTNPVTKSTETFTRQEALEQWLNPNTDYTIYGKVQLTDNGNDNIIDMLQIYDYETMVAYTTPSSSDYRITDKLVTGNYLILDPQAASYTYTITKNGAQVPITSISTNDVILYAKSLDESMYTLLVTNQTVKGSVGAITSKGTEMNIGGKTYNIGERCASYIQEKDGKELKSGVSGTFYIDAFNTAVFGTLDQEAVVPYAYITDAFVDYDEGGKSYLTLYASSVSGEPSSYQLKDKVKFNGSSISGENVIDKLYDSANYTNGDKDLADKIYGAGKTPQNTTYSQPARVTIKDNKITEIITLTSDETQTQNDDKSQIVKCKELDRYTYSSSSFTQAGKTAFSVNSSTIVLCVPSDRKLKKQYAKKTPSGAFTSGEAYYIEAYDINSSKTAGLVILYGNSGSLTNVKKDTDFSVVGVAPESTYNETRDDDVFKIDVYAGASNTLKSWTTYDNKEFKDVEPGDVIQFAYDSDQFAQGLITNIKFSDVAAVLDGKENNNQKFNWFDEMTPSEDNNFQSYRFDYRFKKQGTDDDEIFVHSTLGSIPYSRACVYNVSQVLTDEKKLYVTQNGFEKNEDGIYQLDDSDYEEITIAGGTKILRMEEDREEISRYVADTTTDLTINDLRDAKNYGIDCSKILVLSSKGTVKLIVIYN